MDMLRERARMLAAVRAYFAAQGVMEVETPLLCRGIGTDPNLAFMPVAMTGGATRYLQTSPEFAMKRLLAVGSGSIYQICKAFRGEESGRLHNPEFTLLEWYRLDCGLEGLTHDMEALLLGLADGSLDKAATRRASYREVFMGHAGVEPLDASFAELAGCATLHGLPEAAELCGADRPLWLDLLFSHVVQPELGRDGLCFVYDYPACQPSLARAKPGDARWVERVELFWRGVELANGYHELADAAEQARRFEADRQTRRANGQPVPEADSRLLAALAHGLPECSGVALGLDRLLMLLKGVDHIDQVLAFPYARA